MRRFFKRFHAPQQGAVLVEYAILVPFLLFITFGIIQLSLLFIADAVMDYAAFSAARAQLVQGVNTHGDTDRDVSPLKAAQMVCSLISFGSGNVDRIHIPGWGPLPGSDYSQVNTTIQIDAPDNAPEFTVTVNFIYELLFPQLAMLLSANVIDFGMNEHGQLILSSKCTMARSF